MQTSSVGLRKIASSQIENTSGEERGGGVSVGGRGVAKVLPGGTTRPPKTPYPSHPRKVSPIDCVNSGRKYNWRKKKEPRNFGFCLRERGTKTAPVFFSRSALRNVTSKVKPPFQAHTGDFSTIPVTQIF